jgi:hypothetical protein
MEDLKKNVVMQGVAMANNYFFTGRKNKAVEMISTVSQIDPENHYCRDLIHICFQEDFKGMGISPEIPDLSFEFGKNWLGESLEGKSIEVFCDQGIGDTINLLRYLEQLKKKYKCNIVLNCYAFFNEFERLIATQRYIDTFTPFHVKCDFHTNIMSIPAILNNLKFDVYYPVHFKEILKTQIPSQNIIDVQMGAKIDSKRKIGVAWKTNADNPLSQIKSIPVELFEVFRLPDTDIFCLQPNTECPDWIRPLPIKDLYDTAQFIYEMNCVISVDTAVLHLAGILGKNTYGLLPFDSDPRWGDSNTTVWYPSVSLFRQNEHKDWSNAIYQLKSRLEFFFQIV